MTRPQMSVLVAVFAVLVIAAFAIAQASDYANAPLVAEAPYGADIGRETSCGSLRFRYGVEHSVWKGGVRDGHDQAVEPHLAAMRAILRRIQTLTDQGRCGG